VTSRRAWLAGALAAVAILAVAGAVSLGHDDWQAEVAARGASVMPFDLDATTHEFRAEPDGGVQTVTADEPDDAGEVALVRHHLQLEADRFAAGDLSDPAAIHGHHMPGLAALENAGDRLSVRYTDVPGGGRITYRSADREIVQALHDWFAAQLADHGADAHG
jgi:hypothetical protein